MSEMNRRYTAGNPCQGTFKKVLCVCSAGLLRSPTAAFVLASPPWNFNTRAAGCVTDYALIPVDAVLVDWADEIVFMQSSHRDIVAATHDLSDKEITVLEIENNYAYRDPTLMRMIKERYEASHP